MKPRPRGVLTRNGAKIGRGSSCMEAATEAKEDPKPWKRQQVDEWEKEDAKRRRSPIREVKTAGRMREEKGH